VVDNAKLVFSSNDIDVDDDSKGYKEPRYLAWLPTSISVIEGGVSLKGGSDVVTTLYI